MRSKFFALNVLVVLAAACMAFWASEKPAQAQRKVITRTIEVNTDNPFLGIEMEDVTADNLATYKLSGERGVIVKRVEKGSPAESAGLQEKDVIWEFAGIPVISAVQLSRMVKETPIGRKVDLVVSREGKKMNLSAKIGKRESGDDAEARHVEIMPGWGGSGNFDFRTPAPRSYSLRIPEGEMHSFEAPEKGVFVYSNEKPRLGVTLQPVTDQMAEFLGVPEKKGALVSSVTAGSPAAGKLKAGDVITKAGQTAIAGPEDLIRAVSKVEKGGKIELSIVRDKKPLSLSIELPKEDSKDSKGGYRL